MLDYKLNDLEVKRGFRRLARKNSELTRRILSFIGEAVVNRTVEHHLSGQTLKRQTGTLAKSIRYKMVNDYKAVVGTNVKYGAIHEFGGVIEPRDANMLSFKIKDQWVSTKRVIMPARPYLYPSLNWVMRNEAEDIFNKQAQLWIDKEFEGGK